MTSQGQSRSTTHIYMKIGSEGEQTGSISRSTLLRARRPLPRAPRVQAPHVSTPLWPFSSCSFLMSWGVRETKGTCLGAPPSSKPCCGTSSLLTQIQVTHQPTSPSLSPKPVLKGLLRSSYWQSWAAWAGAYTHIPERPSEYRTELRSEEQGLRPTTGSWGQLP